MNRDVRTLGTVSAETLALLKNKKVAVVGAGGLGGYVIEMLARFGVGTIKVIDGDVFDETNLNRQLYSSESNLGQVKVEVVKERIKEIRSDIQLIPVYDVLTEVNSLILLEGMDVVMDCVDNVPARFIISDTCNTLNIPMVHGAVGAWNGQVMTVYPGDSYIEKLYKHKDIELQAIGAASFIPATIASYQVAECIKILSNKGETLKDKLLLIDLLYNENIVVDMSEL